MITISVFCVLHGIQVRISSIFLCTERIYSVSGTCGRFFYPSWRPSNSKTGFLSQWIVRKGQAACRSTSYAESCLLSTGAIVHLSFLVLLKSKSDIWPLCKHILSLVCEGKMMFFQVWSSFIHAYRVFFTPSWLLFNFKYKEVLFIDFSSPSCRFACLRNRWDWTMWPYRRQWGLWRGDVACRLSKSEGVWLPLPVPEEGGALCRPT